MSKLNEAVFGCIQSALRRGGMSIPFEQLEAMKVDTDRLADEITSLIRDEALVPAKRLQVATKNAFEAMEADVVKLEKRVEYLIKISGVDHQSLSEALSEE